MNMHELPMIAFTVLAQMSVGAFIVLGVINTAARLRGYDTHAVEEISDPAVLAVGAALLLGLGASTFHMNDVFHVFNVFRHLETSWLSREIVSGMLFASTGFLYTACQLFRIGSAALRQTLAFVAAACGVLLIISMSMVYISLPTVPVWATWLTFAQFATTTLLLGAFAIGTAFVTVTMLRRRGMYSSPMMTRLEEISRKRAHLSIVERLGGKAASEAGTRLILSCLRGIAVAGIVLLVLQIAWYVLIFTHLLTVEPKQIALNSAQAYTGAAAIIRFTMTVLGAGLLGLFLFRLADPNTGTYSSGGDTLTSTKAQLQWGHAEQVAVVMTVAFVLVFVAEFIARSQFYTSMFRVGI
ncbi:DMSO reductase anchor subunit [Dermatophilus congolensis]|uniref:DMSO reductase anchor subunit n=1 Tax=Dermatophilus congolensis TaxID=1863 RepID=A0AA46H101_9MICO|nr:DmsC/YnfH family molybdoenzyme membrane anchor subunit [Dermatophilus congolensis]STD12268.1 DMSO reductase anchor subunit [Dermatophilus congolensis]